MEDVTLNPNRQMDRKEWFRYRHKARTDLEWLCRNVLNFKDVSSEVSAHAKIIRAVQQFTGGKETDAVDLTLDALRKGYKPHVPLYEQYNPSFERRTLILVSRGFLKTSIKTVAHNIQWTLNYPDVRILLSSGTGTQVTAFVWLILQQYRYNDIFRWLFPEHVPWGNVQRWGSGEGFITAARQDLTIKEPTIRGTSIDSAVAGGHYDVIDHDDVVNEVNVRTPESIASVNQHLTMTAPLLDRREGKPGWTDFVGTRYDYTDAYGLILDSEKKKEPKDRVYNIVFEPAWTGNWGTADVKPTWPSRWPIAALKTIENDPLQGASMLASQYGLKPRPASSGLIEDKKQIIKTPRSVLTEMMAGLRKHVTIDLHGFANTTNQNKHGDNDYTAIVLTGFSREGHIYILSVLHGRPQPEDVINYLFVLYNKYPDIVDIKCQRDQMANTIWPFLQKEQSRRQIFLPIVLQDISNQISKKAKIRGLRPYFQNGDISFAQDIPCMFHLEEEIIRFPKFHDDILDAISDQLRNRNVGDINTDTLYRPKLPHAPGMIPGSQPRFIGFNEQGIEMWSGIRMEEDFFVTDVDPITGM